MSTAVAMDMSDFQAKPVDAGDRLSFTLFMAIAIHALIILGVTFKMPPASKGSQTIEITLATHKSAKAPKDADFLAQHNQEGSGTEEKARQLTTEKHAEFADTQVRNVNPLPQVAETSTAQKKQQQIVTTTGLSDFKLSDLQSPKSQEEKEKHKGLLENQTAITTEIATLQARLDKQKQEYARRPRVRTLTAVSAKESFDAEYLIKWSEKFERVGTKNYPGEALAKNITGRVMLSVTLRPDGSVEEVLVTLSSGSRILDDSARQIVRLAAPYAKFPPEISRQIDRLKIIRYVRFEPNNITTSDQ
ncbi:transporter TonB [Cellvibrio zantedeschiae]|uniref:Transporter TonB n=1 Tax=Cellvibrio zantedeschiae TaxID=1237077 RepID=A0ABQ3BBA6_9GAMM|nr:energy transducer TonB [Cellvibrio zantedeschiae]GGY82655.1 transporter TonB [Cellvibrio zantedeschiae]